MRRFSVLAAAFVLALSGASLAQQPGAIKAAADALGASNLKSLQFTASGRNFSVGQPFNPADAWPPVTVKSYTAAINYDTGSMRVELLREMGAEMPRGGGAPFFGEQRQVQVVSGNDAWNVPPAPPGGGAAPGAQPQPAAAAERMLQLWSTPHGFLRAAQTNNATTRSTSGGTEASFTVAGKYKMTGIINAQNQVARVQTWIDNPVLGDMLVETTYSGYRDFGGVQFPSRIVQNQGGHPALELTVSAVQANPAVDITTPQNVRGATPPPVRVEARPVVTGIHYLLGGSHHSVAIEMRDHIVVVEGPLNEERSLPVIAKAKELIPNKPVRFVINTHVHFDHSGGLRTYVDEGATIVTHQGNRSFYEKAWAAPRTLNPDRLAQSKKKASFQTVGNKDTLTDGSRTIEMYPITGNAHTPGIVMVYLPQEKILIEADAFTLPPPNGQMSPPAIPFARVLNDNIQRLKLDVQQILPLHGPGAAKMDDLSRAIGRTSTN